jgi:hypothetical protein
MNYEAFTDDSLVMMHHGARGALAVDDELFSLGLEPRFRVRETPDWKSHAAGLEAEMVRRGMTVELIDWTDTRAKAAVAEPAPSPEASQRIVVSLDVPVSLSKAATPEGDELLSRRIAAVLAKRRSRLAESSEAAGGNEP